ncbi:MAG: hypothetical protein N2652_03415 [Kiritimatiellae bacterium]|nr:hypothetical protein [Kiritimatiellia bacterium]
MKRVSLAFVLAALVGVARAQPTMSPPAEPSPPAQGRPGGPLTFAQLDLNGDGGVVWDEFLRAHARAAGRPEDKAAAIPAKEMTRLRRIFREADNDRSGILTQKEWDEYPRK